MAEKFKTKRNDTKPIAAQLLTGTTPVNLAGASVKFLMYTSDFATEIVNTAATITDAATGKVSYTFAAADTDVAGVFFAEWEITFGSGVIQTHPESGYVIIVIARDLG